MSNDAREWVMKKGKFFIKDIGVKEGDAVLDFGCGVGHYTIPAAEIVGAKGKVYAADHNVNSLKDLIRTAQLADLKNIAPVQMGGLKLCFKNESFDVVLLYDILHYMNAMERKKLYNECYSILKADGILSVYPKHNKSDEPLWNLSDMQLQDVTREIKNSKFIFAGQLYRNLLHDYHYNKGYVLDFKRGKS
jgi:ubiquinone/menaquinone biosynthesis C-methylase UbiE